MTDQVVSSTDIQRIERGVERMNDKVDLVWTGVTELQAKFVRLETESINISKETERNKQELENYKSESLKKLETQKDDLYKKIEGVEDRLSVAEKNHSNLMVRLAPFFLFFTVVISVISGKIVSAAFPSAPQAPAAQSLPLK